MATASNPDAGPVQVGQRAEVVEGQAQGPTAPPRSDGKHFVHEVVALTDRIITDITHPHAVQVPEGVGASTAGHRSPLGEALATGTPEAQFAKAEDRDPDDAPDVSPDEVSDETAAVDKVDPVAPATEVKSAKNEGKTADKNSSS